MECMYIASIVGIILSVIKLKVQIIWEINFISGYIAIIISLVLWVTAGILVGLQID